MELIKRTEDNVIVTIGQLEYIPERKRVNNLTINPDGKAGFSFFPDLHSLVQNITIDDIPQEVKDMNLSNVDLARYLSHRYKHTDAEGIIVNEEYKPPIDYREEVRRLITEVADLKSRIEILEG